MQPDSGLAVLWTLAVLLLDLVYTALWVPMDVAFCTAQYGNPASACTQSDLAGGALYTMNLIVSFQVGAVWRRLLAAHPINVLRVEQVAQCM